MANKQPKQSKKNTPAVKEPQQRKPEPKRQYTLLDCMKLGRIANILFVVFIILCLIYYYSFAKFGKYVIPFEVVAYTIEMLAFAFFTLSVVWMDRLVRQRLPMKILLIVYIVAEVILMLLEFDFIPLDSYNGLSLWLTILHTLFSAGIAFSLLLLAPESKQLQRTIILVCSVMLAGMFLGLAGYRVYASILLNAFAYIVFFSIMIHLLRNEDVSVDCYGDRAESKSFTSTMFADSPLLAERPEKETVSQKLKKTASTVANKLTPQANPNTLLTDTDSFEYEFGVDEEDDDWDEDWDEDCDYEEDDV